MEGWDMEMLPLQKTNYVPRDIAFYTRFNYQLSELVCIFITEQSIKSKRRWASLSN